DYTGFEIEPSVRLVLTPNERRTLWGALTRAIRVPARGETDIFLPALAGPGILAGLSGNPDLDSEDLLTYELGYRFAPDKPVSFEVALYMNEYEHLPSLEVMAPNLRLWNGWPVVGIPVEARNNLDAHSFGGAV